MHEVYDLILVGSGPANIFVAIELFNRKIDPKKMLILEKGKSSSKRKCLANNAGCQRCSSCAIINGFGGAGMFSDGKLVLERPEVIFDNEYIDRVFEHLAFFGLKKMDADQKKAYSKAIDRAQIMLKEVHLNIIENSVSQHIGTDNIMKISKKIEEYFNKVGMPIYFDNKVEKISFDRDRQLYKIDTIDSKAKNFSFYSKCLVVGMGKSANHDFSDILGDFKLKMVKKPATFGVRYEFPKDALLTITSGIIKDPGIFYQDKNGNEICTFCTCYGGNVIPYYTGKFLLLGGHSNSTGYSNLSNFGLIYILDNENVFSPSDYLYNYANQVKAIGNNKPLIQTYGDFVNASTANENDVHNTTISYYKYFDLNLVLPSRITEGFKNIIESLSKIDKRFGQRDNIVSMPIIELFVPTLKLTENYESSYSNLYFSGVSSGHAMGIISSATTGIKIAESVEKRIS